MRGQGRNSGGCQWPSGTRQRRGFGERGGSSPCRVLPGGAWLLSGPCQALTEQGSCRSPVPPQRAPAVVGALPVRLARRGRGLTAGAAADWAPSRSRQRTGMTHAAMAARKPWLPRRPVGERGLVPKHCLPPPHGHRHAPGEPLWPPPILYCGAAVINSASLQAPRPQNCPAAVPGRGCPTLLPLWLPGCWQAPGGLFAACVPGRAGAESLPGVVCWLSISAALEQGWSDPGAAPTSVLGAWAGDAGQAVGSAGTGSQPLRSATASSPREGSFVPWPFSPAAGGC